MSDGKLHPTFQPLIGDSRRRLVDTMVANGFTVASAQEAVDAGDWRLLQAKPVWPPPVAEVREALVRDGYAIVEGFPACERLRLAMAPALETDPRAPLKKHARDVLVLPPFGDLYGAMSIAHKTARGEVIDDFSRTQVLDYARDEVEQILALIPGEHGVRMSVDFFRYSTGVEVGRHKDDQGTWVVIAPLHYDGSGGENYLIRDSDGVEVVRQVLLPGQVLIFNNGLFGHGVSRFSGSRDVMILILLRGWDW